MSIAKNALRRLCSREGGLEPRFINDGNFISINRPSQKKWKYDYAEIIEQMKSGRVDVSTIADSLQRKAAYEYLKRKGFKRAGINLYVLIK